MTILLTSIILAVAMVAALIVIGRKSDERDLDTQLLYMRDRALLELDPSDIARLDKQLADIQLAGMQAAKHGVSVRAATKMVMQAQIQSIAAFIEIDRMFDAKSHP
ncbi:hypothetical protein [Sphingomonas sp. 28-63-12]|uniref:hypothetical protein n=1 Tax=Sphingomonas sp. 28-63-12 TaxID=1970434 RepID=UPI000BD285CF|nr:MAG: hypothetical protein B7Y47_12500 [Sphingomonas sp. 28-63-12]